MICDNQYALCYKKVSHASSARLFKKFEQILIVKLCRDYLSFTSSFFQSKEEDDTKMKIPKS